MILSQSLATVAGQNLARPAYRYLGKETNYGELRTAIGRLSYLYQHDLGPHPRVAFLARNAPAVITAFFAMSNIRALVIPMNPDALPDELLAWLKDTKPTHLAVTSDLVGKARELLHMAHLNLPVIEIEKKHGGEYDTSFKPPADNVPQDSDAILLLRTAGLTGKPKYIPMTHKQLSHAAVSLRSLYHGSPGDRVHTKLHWSHPFAFVHSMLYPILTGATCVIDHGLEAVEFLDFLVESRVNRMIGTPAFFHKLLVTCKNEKRMLPGIKSVTVGLGFISPELRKLFGLLKIGVSQVHGQAENVWTIAMEDLESKAAEQERGFVGRGLPGLKYRVIDDNGDEVPGKGTRTGQLAVMGPTIMSSYVDRERESKAAIRGTWLCTGDIFKLEGDGDDLKMTFLGRKEDLAKVDGHWTNLAQVEAVLRTLPATQDHAAFVVRNSKGETAILCAIVKVGGNAITEKQVIEYCHSKLPGGLVPAVAIFTDFIPRDSGGNINYVRLRSQFGGVAG